MRKIYLVVFAYLASIIGAGFATGNEIVCYFVKYGKYSVLGVMSASIGFGVFAYFVLGQCVKNKSDNISDYLTYLMPPIPKRIVNVLLFLFMEIALGCMISAFSSIMVGIAMGQQLWAIVFCIINAAILFLNREKIIAFNSALGWVIVLGLIAACLFLINRRCVNVVSIHYKIQSSAALYVGYNSLSVVAILCSMSRFLKNRRECALVSIITIILSFIILILIWCILSIYYGKISLGDIPMVTLAKRQGMVFYVFYSTILLFAILSTSICNCIGLLDSLRAINKNEKINVFFLVTIGYFISGFGLNTIVDTLYRGIGYGSFILFYFILKKSLKNLKKADIYRIKEKIKDNMS